MFCLYFVRLLTAISTCSLRNCRELFRCRRRLQSALSPPGNSPDVTSSSCPSPSSPWTSSSRCLEQQLTDHLQILPVSKLNLTFKWILFPKSHKTFSYVQLQLRQDFPDFSSIQKDISRSFLDWKSKMWLCDLFIFWTSLSISPITHKFFFEEDKIQMYVSIFYLEFFWIFCIIQISIEVKVYVDGWMLFM